MVSLRYIRSYKCFHISRNIRHEIEKACSIKRAKFKKSFHNWKYFENETVISMDLFLVCRKSNIADTPYYKL